jgi:hypothetical protein
VGGGESGYIAPDPHDPEVVYAGSYGGEITRYNHHTGEEMNVTPWPVNPIGSAAADQKYRFQWTEPIVFSPHDPNTLYFAAQVLFKTSDAGMNWKIISPDLTRNDKAKQQSSGGPITKDNTGVEVYSTIFSVVESTLQKDLIWTGSDDGLIQITTDGGKTWSNVTPKNMPEWGTVSMIEASHYDAGTAYVAVERHRLDDFAPYMFKTTDFGKTWTTITNGIPAGSYAHAVREDRKRKGLLYAATEDGIFFSWDDGGNWQTLQTNLPPVPVWDIYVHSDDLIAATHGRSFWILDDLSPLQQYKPENANDDVHLYAPQPASRATFGGGFGGGGGAAGAVGQNPPAGAVIYYALKTAIKRPEPRRAGEQSGGDQARPDPRRNPPVTLEILDQKGQVVRKYPAARPADEESSGEEEAFGRPTERPLPTEAGLNRFVWDLRYEGSSRVPHSPLWAGNTDGPIAAPGTYQVRLTVQGKAYTAPLEVKADPRSKATQPDLEKQLDLQLKIRDRLTQAHDTINQVRDIRAQMAALNKRLEGQPQAKAVAEAGKQLDKKMTEVEEVLVQTKARSNQDVLNYPIRLNNYLAALRGVVESSEGAPTQASYDVYEMLNKQLDEQLGKWKQILATDVPAYNDTVQKQSVPAIILSNQHSAAGALP